MSQLQRSSEGELESQRELEVVRRHLGELTDALVETNDHLVALYQLTELSTASLDSEIAAGRTMNEARSVLAAEWSAFMAHGEDGERMPVAIVGDVARDRALDAAEQASDRAAPLIGHDEKSDRSFLATPVVVDGRLHGYLVVGGGYGRRFTTVHLKLLGALANQLAVMLELSHLHNEAIRRTIMERDHDTASILAQAALHRPLPEVSGLNLAAFNRPARAAGGDFYAAARCGRGVYLALGDVSGKGLPAALIMTTAISATYGAFERAPDGDANEVLSDIDKQLSAFLTETGMFITLAVAYVDIGARKILVSNAGQSPVILRQDGAVTHVPPNGPPIGVLLPREHVGSELQFDGGDLLFIGSDGWTDQDGPNHTMFSADRLDRMLVENPADDPDDLIERLVDAVDLFASGVEQVDDITALVVCDVGGRND